jgi:putative ABC transport system permease protein
MTRVALRGLAARKLRAALTMLAIVLGVAMVSGAYVLTDTLGRATEDLFADVYGEADAVVTWKRAFETGDEESRPFPDDVLARVRALPEVEVAVGEIDSQIQLTDPDGELIDTGPVPTFGWGFDLREPRFYPLELASGQWPGEAGEAVIDPATADRGYGVGDRIGVAARGPVEFYRVAGIARYSGADPSLTPVFALFTISEAQRLLGKEGRFDSIKAAAAEDVSADELVRAIASALPPTLQVRTGEEEGEADAADISEVTTILRYVLLGFAGVALFVGAFVIFNTLSITVAQRVREFAVLRTIGATRRQILASVVVEALVVGAVAALGGLFLGLALAEGLRQLFSAIGFDLPPIDLVLAPRTIVVSLLVGVLVTLAAGLVPAIRATRVPPIAAVREGAVLPASRFVRLVPVVAGAAAALAVVLLAYGLAADLGTGARLGTVGAGCLHFFLAVALVSPRLVPPVAAIVGLPAARLGGAPGRLALENVTRTPGRTAATAGALMVGLAFITFVAVIGSGIRTSIASAVARQVEADYVLAPTNAVTPFRPGAGDTLADVSGTLVVPVRGMAAEIDGSRSTVTGVDFPTVARVYRFDWTSGSDVDLEALGPTDAIVERGFAEERGLAVGERTTIVSQFGERVGADIRAIYDAPPFWQMLGQVTIPLATFDGAFADSRNLYAFVHVPGGVTADTTRRLEQGLDGFPTVKLQTIDAFSDDQQAQIDPLLNMLYALLGLAVIVAFFGIVNTLALSVVERTRELGLLRAVGMTRRQARRMIRYESVITASIGVTLGIGLGILGSALIVAALSRAGLAFSIPVGSLVVFALACTLAGVVAAVFPARRAARLDILRALQYE